MACNQSDKGHIQARMAVSCPGAGEAVTPAVTAPVTQSQSPVTCWRGFFVMGRGVIGVLLPP